MFIRTVNGNLIAISKIVSVVPHEGQWSIFDGYDFHVIHQETYNFLVKLTLTDYTVLSDIISKYIMFIQNNMSILDSLVSKE
jgi:hypothetical protein